jgi:hypothetical protein
MKWRSDDVKRLGPNELLSESDTEDVIAEQRESDGLPVEEFEDMPVDEQPSPREIRIRFEEGKGASDASILLKKDAHGDLTFVFPKGSDAISELRRNRDQSAKALLDAFQHNFPGVWLELPEYFEGTDTFVHVGQGADLAKLKGIDALKLKVALVWDRPWENENPEFRISVRSGESLHAKLMEIITKPLGCSSSLANLSQANL